MANHPLIIMEHKIIEQKDNKFFNRGEVRIILEADKNPSFDSAAGSVAEKLKANKDNILVKKIKGKFGRNTFLIEAEIYKNKEDKDKQAAKLVKKKAAPGA